MSLSRTTLDRSVLWEKSYRKLSSNSLGKILQFHEYAKAIINKCLENPTEPKYFKLKVKSASFQSKIASLEGGVDFFYAAGFENIVEDGEKMLFLAEYNEGHLKDSLLWLSESIENYTAMNTLYFNQNMESPCASCLLSIRLPNGSTTIGGFQREETLTVVLSFVALHFDRDR